MIGFGYADKQIENAMPDPEAWPACNACGTDYILRRVFGIAGGRGWAWFKDCRGHRGLPMLRRKDDSE